MIIFPKKMCGAFSMTSTPPICMSFPKTAQESRRGLDRIYKIDRISHGEQEKQEFVVRGSPQFQKLLSLLLAA